MRRFGTRRGPAIALASITGAALAVPAVAATRTQNFNSDPGWLREGIPNDVVINGDQSNFGFTTDDNTGSSVNPPGGTATGGGEAGGRIATTVCASYGDDVGLLSLNDPITFSGVFRLTSADQDAMFGFYNSAAVANVSSIQSGGGSVTATFLPQTLGIETTARGRVFNDENTHNLRIHMGGVGTTTVGAQFRPIRFNGDDSPNPVITNTTYAFTFDYNPSGGASGNGLITLTVQGAQSTTGTDSGTVELTAAQRASGITFDRFGLIPNVIRGGGGPEFLYIDDVTYTIASVVTNATWNVDSNGNWSTAGNWLGGVPNAAGATANFGAVISAPRTVTLDAPQTVGAVNFNNSNSYTLAGGGAFGGGNTLTIQTASGSGAIALLQGNHVISAPLALASDTVLSGPGTLKIAELSVASGKALDMGDRSLVVDYTGASPRAALEALVGSGYAGGAHNGAGIRTSAGTASRGLGIAEASETNFGGSYNGHTLDFDSLVIRYTLLGDADLSGTVTIGDFSRLAANFNTAGRWAIGDFNYDGSVNIGDFSLLAANFNQSLPADGARSAVPEPAAVSTLAAMALLRRRRN